MSFSVELELHDAIRRPDSVGNFLSYRQILPPDPASAGEPTREPAAHTVRRGVRPASSGWAGSGLGRFIRASGRLSPLASTHRFRKSSQLFAQRLRPIWARTYYEHSFHGQRGFAMAGNLKKFVNPRFIKTIDLTLMKSLLARHEGEFTSFLL